MNFSKSGVNADLVGVGKGEAVGIISAGCSLGFNQGESFQGGKEHLHEICKSFQGHSLS